MSKLRDEQKEEQKKAIIEIMRKDEEAGLYEDNPEGNHLIED